MLTTNEAFRKFKSRLELNKREQENASARQKEVREFLNTRFEIENSFLTGSYARNTKTKPLKDIDIFFVLDDAERHYRNESPPAVIDDFYNALAGEYGGNAVMKQRRSVNVDFGVFVDAEDNTDYRILSIDVVPAFVVGEDYEIPDTFNCKWIKTNPKIHAEKAIEAHQGFSSEWKGLVRIIKYWNNNVRHGENKPVKPSFLIEVMALECLHGGWHGRFDYEIESFFATLADRVFDTWHDPARLGPPVSDGMDDNRKRRARDLLTAAKNEARDAINLAQRGSNGKSLQAWRDLFGPKFPLS